MQFSNLRVSVKMCCIVCGVEEEEVLVADLNGQGSVVQMMHCSHYCAKKIDSRMVL